MKRTTWLAAALVAAGLLTGCSQGGSTDAAQTPTAPPVDPALRVPSPLPSGTLVSDPCSALSPAQVTEIGLVSPGEPYPSPSGQGCRWQSQAYDANKIFIAPLGNQQTGLTGVYANRAQDKYFEPVTIDGYPAVFAANADLRSRGTCALWVGVTDQLVVNVNSSILDGPNVTDPCPIVEKVAVAMVQHLKGAA
ncbi:DUF3558 domain-containing protein [Amycolatopsis thermalba]|uniref:DUF3558 domain-containing protein n=1 Tax=Amycolatopsis thermalba TaxID=944492 RepID=A0ABY4NMP7_9PSEU|nr:MULTISPECIES: DUF3558 domain-containing protein [Amycolatopsis]OXM74676.1 hypothetical protein CF166_03890 [Amycolatopsis sp. KNN50.9b]UQS21687.1 DUF3558 domain-containing protein [Amycolatopsis thermalba]